MTTEAYRLDRDERRVLGVLIEKGYTTPDQYPLTLNAIVSGCNQKSCRDPQMSLDEVHVFDAIDSLRKQGLVITAQSSRVDRFRHCVPDMLEIGARETAILAELLLRGPQTDGELRQRANRMVTLADLDQVRACIETLMQRGLATRLGSGERRRGVRYAHALYPEGERPAPDPEEDEGPGPSEAGTAAPAGGGARTGPLPGPATAASSPPAPAVSSPPAVSPEVAEQLDELMTLIADLTDRVEALEQQVRG